MNGILGMVDLALDTALDAEQRGYLETVQSSAESLLAVIEDILDFARMDTGERVLAPVEFDVRQLIGGTARLIALRAEEKDLSFSCRVDADVPATAYADTTCVGQVLTNLLANAVKFTERGEVSLEVAARRDEARGTALRFTVSDTGIGIEREQLSRIFAPFTQADFSSTRAFGGAGLGLAISARLVELMGGHLWVESEASIGSIFSFTVPCDRSRSRESTKFDDARAPIVRPDHRHGMRS